MTGPLTGEGEGVEKGIPYLTYNPWDMQNNKNCLPCPKDTYDIDKKTKVVQLIPRITIKYLTYDSITSDGPNPEPSAEIGHIYRTRSAVLAELSSVGQTIENMVRFGRNRVQLITI